MPVKIHGSRSRGASTLIEVLLVVGILSVLIALLIPAIQSIRAAAKKTQNQNNIKQILVASLAYAAANDGQLPKADTWTGEGCCPLPVTVNGSSSTCNAYYVNGICNKCPNGLVVKSEVKGVRAINTLDSTKFRDNWVEGTPYFALLPYLGEKAIYDLSYGGMTSGQIYLGDQGAYQCIAFDENGCSETVYVPGPTKLVDETTISSRHNGKQGGRMPALVKTFLGSGDPTSEFPGMLAPLSYPMFSNVEGSIENYNTSCRPYITEAYAGCETVNPWNSWNGGTPSYNSWAASTFVNMNFEGKPMLPGYSTVSGGGGSTLETVQVWTGIVTADPACTHWVMPFGPFEGMIFDECATQPSLLTADPLYPQDAVDLRGVKIQSRESSAMNHMLWHVSNDTYDYKRNGQGDYCSTPDGKDAEECHVGEWYYFYKYLVLDHEFWLDHPSSVGCSTRLPMSLVNGSLNLGMLDGSVRSVAKNMDREVWTALINGQMPSSDVDNW